MSNDKLKPCEHCGNVVRGYSSHVGHWVHCECQEPVKTREEAVIQWNTRTPDTRIEEALNIIKMSFDMVDKCEDYMNEYTALLQDLAEIKKLLEGTQ